MVKERAVQRKVRCRWFHQQRSIDIKGLTETEFRWMNDALVLGEKWKKEGLHTLLVRRQEIDTLEALQKIWLMISVHSIHCWSSALDPTVVTTLPRWGLMLKTSTPFAPITCQQMDFQIHFLTASLPCLAELYWRAYFFSPTVPVSSSTVTWWL